MRTHLIVASLILTSLVASQAVAQDLRGIKLNPGERLLSINGVPVKGAPRVQPAAKQTVKQTVKKVAAPAVKATANAAKKTVAAAAAVGSVAKATVVTNIVGKLVYTGLPFSHSPGSTALEKANHERIRNGQQPVSPDASLQALALKKATIAAQRSYKNHIGGSLGCARCEGVGHTQGRFLTCCLDKPASYGGAAMVQGRDGWYCCFLCR